jgi:uncharacterized small protein (DUF1192 family)
LNVDPMRVIDVMKRKLADLTQENALLTACVEQMEPALAEANTRVAALTAELDQLKAERDAQCQSQDVPVVRSRVPHRPPA